MSKQTLVGRFLEAWREYAPGFPMPEREVLVCAGRRWRFDLCWFHPDDFDCQTPFVAVEIDGGAWFGGRHSRAIGQAQDNEKMAAAQSLGWKVVRLNSANLQDLHSCVEMVLEAMNFFTDTNNAMGVFSKEARA